MKKQVHFFGKFYNLTNFQICVQFMCVHVHIGFPGPWSCAVRCCTQTPYLQGAQVQRPTSLLQSERKRSAAVQRYTHFHVHVHIYSRDFFVVTFSVYVYMQGGEGAGAGMPMSQPISEADIPMSQRRSGRNVGALHFPSLFHVFFLDSSTSQSGEYFLTPFLCSLV